MLKTGSWRSHCGWDCKSGNGLTPLFEQVRPLSSPDSVFHRSTNTNDNESAPHDSEEFRENLRVRLAGVSELVLVEGIKAKWNNNLTILCVLYNLSSFKPMAQVTERPLQHSQIPVPFGIRGFDSDGSESHITPQDTVSRKLLLYKSHLIFLGIAR